MDPTKAEKLQAMKKYRKNKIFNYNFLLHLLAGIACSLLFSYAFWFPYCLCSSTKHFFLISLPCIWSSFFNPKCLFIVVNVIVIFLVGESGLVGRSSSSPVRDIYNEYIEKSRSLRGGNPVSTPQEKIIIIRQEKRVQQVEKEAEVKEVVNMTDEEKEVKEEEDGELLDDQVKEMIKLVETHEEKEVITADEAKQMKQEETVVQGTSEIVEEEEEGCGGEKERDIVEEEAELPTEELNKRVEEFIARVNKQRCLEAAQLSVCCRA